MIHFSPCGAYCLPGHQIPRLGNARLCWVGPTVPLAIQPSSRFAKMLWTAKVLRTLSPARSDANSFEIVEIQLFHQRIVLILVLWLRTLPLGFRSHVVLWVSTRGR